MFKVGDICVNGSGFKFEVIYSTGREIAVKAIDSNNLSVYRSDGSSFSNYAHNALKLAPQTREVYLNVYKGAKDYIFSSRPYYSLEDAEHSGKHSYKKPVGRVKVTLTEGQYDD